ncbi:DUF3558 domain-containing protein [Streptomyces sp. NPDC006552]|uniref:DUF3558 domain-containing protein n=1 Tax=Streptomyces sp. NPDC006552 TaxID=3157179 RepID=UPI0033B524D0
MHRPTKRLTRVLACAAAVPVVLVVAGCSSDSGSGSGSGDAAGKGSNPASSAPATGDAAKKVAPATYKTLPKACSALSKKTLDDLVPKGDSKAGAADDEATRDNCSWSSLDNNGVKGSQFRWLNVSLVRFESDVNRGSGDQLASAYYAKQVKDAQATQGAKSVKTQPVPGAGDEATLVRFDSTYKEKKKDVTSRQQTVVSRVDNVVVTVNYNGSGLAGEKTPDADDLSKDTEKAAKETVASVVASAKSKPSASASSPASSSAKPSPSASKKAGEKSDKKTDDKTDGKKTEAADK